MLKAFIFWARQFAGSQIAKNVKAKITESQISDNASARLDIDTPAAVARITCWESGNYDAEVIDLETERTLYSTHGILQEGEVLSEQFSPFFEALDIIVK